MKNIFRKSILLMSILFVLGACDDREFIELVSDANTTVNVSTSTVVLTEDIATNEVLTVSWSDPNYGFDAAPSYKLLIDLAGGDFTAPQIIAVGADLNKVFTAQELNGKMLSLGLKPSEATNIDFMVQTTLSDAQIKFSQPVSLTVTAYSSLLDLSSAWGLVGNATPGGWGNEFVKDVPFYSTATSGVYVCYATLKDGYIKIRKDNLWAENYGDNEDDGVLDAAGSDIAVTAGTYKITFNENDLSWSKEEYTWGLVGSAAPNGWDGPDFKLNYNSYQDNWVTVVTLVEGAVKFRFNNDWGLNYGDTGADGSLETGGDDINVDGGHYLVTFDLNNLEYTLEKVDVWGLVGSATPNGWGSGGPDTKFIPDFGINEGIYYINGIELWNNPGATDVGDMVKIRQNDAWGVNYGSNDFTNNGGSYSGSLELSAPDMPLGLGTDEKGIYNIVFDSINSTIAIYAWPE